MDLAKLDASVKTHEGKRNRPYQDSLGILTVGYGHNLSNGLSDDIIDAIYIEDRNLAILEAREQAWWAAVSDNDARSRAMVEMVLNLGTGKLNGFLDALGYLVQRAYPEAANAFLDSLWAKQVGNRAAVLTEMIRTGNDPA